jgi:hypothetical protein
MKNKSHINKYTSFELKHHTRLNCSITIRDMQKLGKETERSSSHEFNPKKPWQFTRLSKTCQKHAYYLTGVHKHETGLW